MHWNSQNLARMLQVAGRTKADRKPAGQTMIDPMMVGRSCFVQKLAVLNSMAVRRPTLAPAYLAAQTRRPVRASMTVQMLRVDRSPKACQKLTVHLQVRLQVQPQAQKAGQKLVKAQGFEIAGQMATASRIQKAPPCPLLYQSGLDAHLALVGRISQHHPGRSRQFPSGSRTPHTAFEPPALLALRSLLLPLHSGVVEVLQSSVHAGGPQRAVLGHYAQGRSMKRPIPVVPGRWTGLF